jgi:Bacteriophage replication gene A protein (GPA)
VALNQGNGAGLSPEKIFEREKRLTVNGYSIAAPDWWRLSEDTKAAALERELAKALPRLWLGKITTLAKRAGHGGRDALRVDVLSDWLDRYSGAKSADMSESEIRDKAEHYAKQAQGRGFESVLERLNASGYPLLLLWCDVQPFIVDRLGFAAYPKGKDGQDMRGLVKRLECQSWWRRQLRRMVARKYESGCYELGLTGAKAGAWYCSDRAVIRRRQQNQANAEMMAASTLQNENGQTMTLADIAAKTTANKAIRRGELMTRIRGCEQWADSAGLVGLFTTNTLPSRFHSQLKEGGRNPKFDGSTPADGQRWQCKTWAQLRAKLHRDGVGIVGFRVAEPHHDGCPHWHMLIWCAPENVETVKALMVKYWLREDGDERGAATNRVNIKTMISGMAAGYVAKYIAKNIDGAHVATQTDDYAAGFELGNDLLGDAEVTPSQRVEAWAATWNIRQFQAIGQPPVTVWRELRRVDKSAVAGGTSSMIHAWLSVHKEGEKQADWQKYMKAQGGAMLARKDYKFCVHTIKKQRKGRYGDVVDSWACGVVDRASGRGAIPTKRVQWGAEGFAARRIAPPWTRLNNCTPKDYSHNRPNLTPTLDKVKSHRVWDLEAKYSSHCENSS